MSAHTTMAHDYASALASASEKAIYAESTRTGYQDDDRGHRRHHTWQTAYDAACHAMTWCDLRRLAYADAAEAIRLMRGQ